jgi:hypothetical protein
LLVSFRKQEPDGDFYHTATAAVGPLRFLPFDYPAGPAKTYRRLHLSLCFPTGMGYERAMKQIAFRRYGALPVLVVLLTAVASCTSGRDDTDREACRSGLEMADQELRDAKAKGFRGGVDIAQATSLIGAAKVQYEFKRYPNCVDKVRRARIHIRKAQER